MVMLYEELSASPLRYKNVVVAPPGAIDCSPCRTGTSAMLARLHHLGALDVGGVLINEGILGTTFLGRVARRVEVGDIRGIVPEITGRAYMTGLHQWVLDPGIHSPEAFCCSRALSGEE